MITKCFIRPISRLTHLAILPVAVDGTQSAEGQSDGVGGIGLDTPLADCQLSRRVESDQLIVSVSVAGRDAHVGRSRLAHRVQAPAVRGVTHLNGRAGSYVRYTRYM